jgi:hypothetical protein
MTIGSIRHFQRLKLSSPKTLLKLYSQRQISSQVTRAELATKLGIQQTLTVTFPIQTTISTSPAAKFFQTYRPTGAFANHPAEPLIQQQISTWAKQTKSACQPDSYRIHMSVSPPNGLNNQTILASIEQDSGTFHFVLNPPNSFMPDDNVLIFPKTTIQQDYVETNHGGVGNWIILPFSLMAIQELSKVNLKDQHIIDFGAGDGILALYALKKGAAKVTCFEKDTQLKK